MSIYLACACGQHFETDDTNAGRHARCPVCGAGLTVPAPPPKALMISDAQEEAVTRARRSPLAWVVVGLVACLLCVALLIPSSRSGRSEAACRLKCVYNLKQIGLAVYNYEHAYGCLPPAAITDKDGRPLLSWRVAILPFIESSTVFSQFHLDEPWDSPHNLALVRYMPSCYACPSDGTLQPGMSNYQAVVGSETAFTPDFKPLRIEDLTDGPAGTLLVGESRRAVLWTKPDDLPFDMTVPLTGLGSHHASRSNSGFNVLLGDGSVRFLNGSITASALRMIITRNGGEYVCTD